MYFPTPKRTGDWWALKPQSFKNKQDALQRAEKWMIEYIRAVYPQQFDDWVDSLLLDHIGLNPTVRAINLWRFMEGILAILAELCRIMRFMPNYAIRSCTAFHKDCEWLLVSLISRSAGRWLTNRTLVDQKYGAVEIKPSTCRARFGEGKSHDFHESSLCWYVESDFGINQDLAK